MPFYIETIGMRDYRTTVKEVTGKKEMKLREEKQYSKSS